MAIIEKNKSTLKEWIMKRSKITYIKLDKEYLTCPFEQSWHLSN
jgi:hypothetical protein